MLFHISHIKMLKIELFTVLFKKKKVSLLGDPTLIFSDP